MIIEYGNPEGVLEFIKSRRSTRRFTQKCVEEDKLLRIVEAGRYAPSGRNNQSCHFTIITDVKVLRKLAEIVQEEFSKLDSDDLTYSSLSNSINQSKKGGYVFHYGAPVLIIVSNLNDYANAMADSACALENMMLMSNAENLGSCWINQLHWLDTNKPVREYLRELGIPESETICGSLSVGYAVSPDGMPNRVSVERKGNPVTWVRG